MEPYEEENLGTNETQEDWRMPPSRWMGILIIALLAAAGIATGYSVHERNQVRQLTEQADAAKKTTDQLQAQVNTLTARLNDLSAAQPVNSPPTSAKAWHANSSNAEDTELAPPPLIAAQTAPSTPSSGLAPVAKPAAPKHTTAKRRATSTADKRYAQLKAQLDDQQKQLQQAEDQIAKNRADLEGSLNSTRDELNGSIAKTHDELVALEKRGERNYFEFDLVKSRQFQRIGPLSLSLRKADSKHKNYDLALIVDDNELSKKKVNLYEPVWIHTENGGQPVLVVVNRIDKNGVHGYVSAPKYKQAELAALTSSSSQPSATTNSGSSSQAASQPTQQRPQR